MEMEMIQKRWLNIKETAEYLGISHRSLYNRTSPKSPNPFPVKPKRIGSRILFDVKALDQFMEKL